MLEEKQDAIVFCREAKTEGVHIDALRASKPLLRLSAARMGLNHPPETVSGKRCLLAAFFSSREKDYQSKMRDLVAFIQAKGGIVVGELIQRRGVSRDPKPGGAQRLHIPLNAKTVFSSGKTKELVEAAVRQDAEVIVFYNSLNILQRKTISKILHRPVMSYLDAQ